MAETINPARDDYASDNIKKPANVAVLTGTLLILLLVAVVAVSPRVPIYDEGFYLESAWFLRRHFDFFVLMNARLDLGAGPFYAYLHHFAGPLTGLRPPAIHYVNVGALIIAILAIGSTIRRLGYDQPMARAAMLLAVPMIWPTSGLALTEIPALTLASLAVLPVVAASRASAARQWPLFLLAGLCAGLAITARQTYLPAIAGLILVGICHRPLLLPALTAAIVAGAVISPMIVAWHGLAPPWVQNTTGLSLEHGIMAFIYLATATLLIAPRYFVSAMADHRARIAAAVAVAAAAVAIVGAGIRLDIANRVWPHLPLLLQAPAQMAASAAMACIAAAMVVATAIHLWRRRADRLFLLLGFLTMMMTGTAAGILWQFSSRYVLAAFPFALLLLQPWVTINRWAVARMIGGAAIGLLSLTTYYRGAEPFNVGLFKGAPLEIKHEMVRAYGDGPGSPP